jgi:hypothetical protein
MTSIHYSSKLAVFTFVFSCFISSCGPGACDCKENDSLGAKRDSSALSECKEAELEMSREDHLEYRKEYEACE